MIPEGWKESTVGKACQICNNLRLPINVENRKEMKGIYPYYGPTGLLDFINEYQLDGEYALIGEDGDHFLKYDDKAMTLLVRGKFNVNNHAHIISGTSNCQTNWFYYYFMYRPLTSYLTRQGAGRYKLNKATLEKIPILIPPVPEQRKIAEILSSWDKAIALLEQLITAKRKLKQGLMQQLLTGKKRFQEFEGSEWIRKSLGEIAKTFSGGTPSRNNPEYYGGTIPWIKSGELNNTNIWFTEEKITKEALDNSSAKLVSPDTILIAMYGATAGVIGISKISAAINQAILAVVPKSLCQNSYLFYFLEYSMIKTTRKVQGGQPNLNAKIINSSLIDIPLIQEQEKISSILSKADTEISTLEKQLAAYKQQKRGLMQQLLTGKKRVKLD